MRARDVDSETGSVAPGSLVAARHESEPSTDARDDRRETIRTIKATADVVAPHDWRRPTGIHENHEINADEDALMEYLAEGLRNIAEGNGIGISITGMTIVFIALSLISAFIAMLPKALRVLAVYLPPEIESHGIPAQTVEPTVEEGEVIAAIGSVLHQQMNSGS